MAFSNPSPMMGGAADPAGYVWATATASASAASTATVTASLPQGAVGKPKKLKVFGTVAGFAQIQIGNAQVVQEAIAPNIVNMTSIPDRAFPGPVNGVTVIVQQLGSGTEVVLVGFQQ
jgi:hypothetical protein